MATRSSRSFTCLGVETSCDETSAAVVRNGRDVLSSVVLSQVDLHELFGGVVPELACRRHVEVIVPILGRAVQEAQCGWDQLDAFAVTYQPGLVGALLVGLSAAKTLAMVYGKPLIGIDHLHAHVYAALLGGGAVEFPAAALVVSGGHTVLFQVDSPISLTPLGATIDDAAGEAFDKVANILGLGYPGGPQLDALSEEGNRKAVDFPRSTLEPDSLDFSFSGIKTAVLYHCKGQNAGRKTAMRKGVKVPDVAASFQEAVVDVLVEKSLRAVRRVGTDHLIVGGGVSANRRLRQRLNEAGGKEGFCVVFAPPELCTDNAAMIAGLAYPLWKEGKTAELDLDAVPTVTFSRG